MSLKINISCVNEQEQVCTVEIGKDRGRLVIIVSPNEIDYVKINLLALLDWCDGPGRDLIAVARAAQ